MPTVVQGDFEWDEAKNLINQEKHGIAFEEAMQLFRGLNHYSAPYAHKTGEMRQYVIGFLQGMEFTVIFTLRNRRIRIISARRSSMEERDELRERNA